MITGLAKEVEKRMKAEGVKGRNITLKIKQRKIGAQEPAKFNGHGPCNNLSKSEDIPDQIPTYDHTKIAKSAINLFKELQVDKGEIRGMGIVMNKLEQSDTNLHKEKISEKSKMSAWLNQSKNEQLHCSEELSGPKHTKIKSIQKANESLLNISAKSFDEKTDSPVSISSSIAAIEEIEEVTEVTGIPQEDERGQMNSVSVLAIANSNLPTQNIQEECLDVMVPNPSQIDEEVLKSLPINIQQEIARKLKVRQDCCLKEAGQFQLHQNQMRSGSRTYPPSTHDRDIQITPRIMTAEKNRQGFIMGRSLEKTDRGDLISMRQISVKRMLKLASVKAGQDIIKGLYSDDHVSMTQLGALPLALQLQVANNDEDPVGSLAGKKRPKTRALKGHDTVCVPMKDDFSTNTTCEVNVQQIVDSEVEQQHLFELYTEESNHNLIHYIIPLSKWLSSKPLPTQDDVDRVMDFFDIVISENRLDHVISMLRHIKNRGDDWSRAPYDFLLESINKLLASTKKCVLDLMTLGLS